MRNTSQKFTVTIPVKPYVKRFLELNYGTPLVFGSDTRSHRFFQRILKKPDHSLDRKFPDTFFFYTEYVEIQISDHDFYRYGWELTKTDIVAFGRRFEDKAKNFMRSVIGVNISMGMPINKCIEKFQDRFGFDEDSWKYEAIKKDFYRNGHSDFLDFSSGIHNKIENIILRNLSDLGTISVQMLNRYENNKQTR